MAAYLRLMRRLFPNRFKNLPKSRALCRKIHQFTTYNRNVNAKYSMPTVRRLQIIQSKSFCSQSPKVSRRTQLRFATIFLYFPLLAATAGAIIYHEKILSVITMKIFERRESFLIKCYPERIILIRHGQSEANIDQHVLGHTPDHAIKLTHLGYKQALHAGRQLKQLVGDEDIYAYYSPYKRAQETLYAIMEGGNLQKQTKTKIEDVRLIEQKFGNRQSKEMMDLEKQERIKYGRFFYQFKSGESGLNVSLRATAFTDRLFDHFRTGYYSTKPNIEWNVLIVSHGLFMRVFLKSFLRKPVADFQKWYNYGNCEICILEKSETGEYVVSPTTPLPLTPRPRVALND